MSQQESVISWLHLAVTVLVQTAVASAFVYGLYVRMGYLERAWEESRMDRMAIRAEVRNLDAAKYQLIECADSIREITARLNNHEGKANAEK